MPLVITIFTTDTVFTKRLGRVSYESKRFFMAAPLLSPYFLKVPISNIAGFYVDISSSCSRPRGSKRGCTVIHKYPEQINSKGFLPSAA